MLGENMKSSYALLPSTKYFSTVSSPVIEFEDDVADIYDFPALYGNFIATKTQMDSFLLGDGGVRSEPVDSDTDTPNVLDTDMLIGANELQDILDNWIAPENIAVSQVVGWGIDTVRGISYSGCDIIFCPDRLSNLDRELLFVEDGDGTVVTPSASAMSGVDTYYVDIYEHNTEILTGLRRNREHADILEIQQLQELLSHIIQDDDVVVLPEHISLEKQISEDNDKRIRVRIHSPVELHIYDAEGNHTGIVPNTDPESDLRRFEANIPNSYYTEFGEIKYAGANTFGANIISLIGEDTGTFTLEVDTLIGGNISTTTTFTDIPVVKDARDRVVVGEDSSVSSLTLDIDDDGVVDAEVTSGEGMDMSDMLSILRVTIGKLDISSKKQKQLEKILVKIEKQFEKEDKCESKKKKEKCEQKRKDKIEHIIDRLIKKIEKMTKGKKAEFSEQEAEEVINLIQNIFNN